jgi:hypothetical protein
MTSRASASRWVRLFTTLAFAAGAGCAAGAAEPARSAADHAAFMEQSRCAADDDDKALGPVLGATAVASMQPLYANAGGGKSGPESVLRGVRLKVTALPGFTPEWLDRALECHSARATLGRLPAAADDPFYLPGSTVDIDVNSARDGFDVDVTAFSSEDVRQLLARASAFMQRKAAAKPQ